MHIFEIVNFEVLPTEEALMIKPIRKMWNSDRSKSKDKFLLLAAIIYYYADPRSSYNYIIEDEARLLAIIELEGLPENYKLDAEMLEAIEMYKKHCITTSYELLEATRIAIHKVSTFLRDVDLNLLDDKGKPVYTINSITTAIRQIPQLTKEIKAAEEAVTKEIEELGNARGGNESKSLMDDGLLL